MPDTPQTAHSWTPETRSAFEAGRERGRADEREACAQLAEQHRATYAVVTRDASCLEGETPTQVDHEPFADLIRARSTP